MALPVKDRDAKGAEIIRPKMEALARFVLHMEDSEIWAFLDALFPDMNEEEKEELFGSILIYQRREDPRRSFDEFMSG